MAFNLRSLTAAILVSAFWAGPAFAQEPSQTTIVGRLFVDINANGSFDQGELALAGIPIEFANGERIETVATGADGSFSLQVEPGLWRATVRPPEGFEYALPEGLELQVVESGQGQLDLQIGLQPVQLLQVLVNALQAGEESGEPGLSEEDGAPESSGPTVDPEVYDGPFVPPDESADPDLLPESGGRLPPRIAAMLAAIGVLVVGLLLWAGGRVLEGRGQAAREVSS